MFTSYVELPSGTGKVYIAKNDLAAYRGLGAAGEKLLSQRLTKAWEKNAESGIFSFGSTTIPGPSSSF